MPKRQVDPARIVKLNDKAERTGQYVVYWMQASQRAQSNFALDYATEIADNLSLPLVAYFELIDDFPEANLRHYLFMLEGLRETEQELRDNKGILLVVGRPGSRKYPDLARLAREAACVVCDRGYTKFQRKWRAKYAARLPCALYQVEADAIVPVNLASGKQAYSAAILRRKIAVALPQFMKLPEERRPRKDSLGFAFPSFSLDDPLQAAKSLDIDRTVAPSPLYHGGAGQARQRLESFVTEKLDHYEKLRNDPSLDLQSGLSPYLHFGQISPHIVADFTAGRGTVSEKFHDELIVRRELAFNFCSYNDNYDSIDCLPDWARKTLAEHARDRREYLYGIDELETAQTHDPYWNAAQTEMLITGKMHGYMRMYWGKKILEWSRLPAEAYRIALYLNDKYELDGRDPNGYAGVAWCFGKHDRAWPSRPIFGKVRYMNAAGLKRKFNIAAYVAKANSLASE